MDAVFRTFMAIFPCQNYLFGLDLIWLIRVDRPAELNAVDKAFSFIGVQSTVRATVL